MQKKHEKKAELTGHEAQSVYAYISELEDYIENQDGEEDLRTISNSLNKGGKLIRGIQKLNVYHERL